MRQDRRSDKQKEKDRQKLETMLIAYGIIILILFMAVMMIIGSSSPAGLTGFMNEIKNSFFSFLKDLRFKLDIYFRFFESLFN